MTEAGKTDEAVETIIELVTDYNAVVAALIVGIAIGAVVAFVLPRFIQVQDAPAEFPIDMAHPSDA